MTFVTKLAASEEMGKRKMPLVSQSAMALGTQGGGDSVHFYQDHKCPRALSIHACWHRGQQLAVNLS